MAMSEAQKLAFVHKMTHLGLSHVQHFDSGGTVLTGPVTAGNQNAINPNSGFAGSIGGILGTNNNYQASGATITPGTNVGQINQAYTGVQGALGQAGNLTGTVIPGVNQGIGSQNLLTNQLVAQSEGQGPNPAKAALNENTGQNIQQQAALAASTRGAGANNAGLIASNAARQGAAIQQQAIGQGATLQAQQQLAAQNQLQNLAATQVGQGTNAVQLQNQVQQNEQNILQGANTSANNANVSQQENINATNAAVAAGNQKNNQDTIAGIGNAISSIGKAFAFSRGGMVMPKHLEGMAKIYHPHMYEGGTVHKSINSQIGNPFGPDQPPPPPQKMAPGGVIWENSNPYITGIDPGQPVNIPVYEPTPLIAGGSSSPSKAPEKGMAPGTNPTGAGGGYGLGGQNFSNELGQNSFGSAPLTSNSLQSPMLGSGLGGVSSGASLGVPALAYGGDVKERLKSGGKVPGKPKVNHDAYKNDTVDAKLSPGEVVIDLNTLKDKGKLGQMARFVAANIERKKMGRSC